MYIFESLADNMNWWVASTGLFCFFVGILVGRRIRPCAVPAVKEKSSDSKPVELYIGNLAFSITERDLEKAFKKYGTVNSARIITNGLAGKSKGFGFVVMAGSNSAQAAMKGMNGSELSGRKVTVNPAKSRSRRD